MQPVQVEYRKVDSLIPYARNARTHSDAQVAQIAASIKEFGWTNPILVDGTNGIIAGHGRLAAARKLAMDTVPVIELAHLTETQKKALILADNKLSLNADWDNEVLALELEELELENFDLELVGFDPDEIDLIKNDSQQKQVSDGDLYSQKINSPVYEITGDKPAIEELYDQNKYTELSTKILNSENLDEDTKKFLLAAASRHIKFNYQQIAEFYAHADIEIQQLMEDSALIIIDYDKAIENGFATLVNEIKETMEQADNEE